MIVSCRFRSTRATEVQAASSAGSTPAGDGRIADAEQLAGRGGFACVLRAWCLDQEAQSTARPPRASAGGPAPGRNARSSRDRGVGPPSRITRAASDSRGLDVGRVVEQDEGLERRVRPRALDDALFAGRGVEGQQAGVQERALPVGVKAAAVLVFALVGHVVARREIEENPVARRLIGLDARAADPGREQAADGQGVVADQLGVEPEAVLVGPASDWRDLAPMSSLRRPRTGGRFRDITIRLSIALTSQPLSTNSLASQSSSSGWVGQAALRAEVVRRSSTSPWPKASFQSRLTMTRATSGLSRVDQPPGQVEPRRPAAP